jgi:hypothetical protein
MILLSSVIKEFKGLFFDKYQTSILPSHKKALLAMEKCRTQFALHMLACCSNQECSHQTYIPHSCGHRNCPHCQNHESWQWIENQLNKQVPAQYYLITFTLPQQLREITWKNQRQMYSLMFICIKEVLQTFSKNDKKLKGDPGFTMVMHTHSRALDYHPHIHVIMPGACVNKKSKFWRVKTGKYLFNYKALAIVFRAKLLNKMVEYNLQIPKCPAKWVVGCKNVGKGDKALIYLGRYLYNYGFLHPCSKQLIKLLQYLLKFNPFKMLKKVKTRAKIICKYCGAEMKIVRTGFHSDSWLSYRASNST